MEWNRKKKKKEIRNGKQRKEIDKKIEEYHKKLIELAFSEKYNIPVYNISIVSLPVEKEKQLLETHPFIVYVNKGSIQEPIFKDDYGEPFFPTHSKHFMDVEYNHVYPVFPKEVKDMIDEAKKRLDIESIINIFENLIDFTIKNYKKE